MGDCGGYTGWFGPDTNVAECASAGGWVDISGSLSIHDGRLAGSFSLPLHQTSEGVIGNAVINLQ